MRFRGTVAPEDLQRVPIEAQDSSVPGRVHWAQPAGVEDPFLAGARWALSWSLTTIFGETLGSLLEIATLSNVQRWNGSQWADVA